MLLGHFCSAVWIPAEEELKDSPDGTPGIQTHDPDGHVKFHTLVFTKEKKMHKESPK